MKEKIKIILPIFILILIIVGLAFYWYELRPNEIRKECFKTKQETIEVYSFLRSVSDEKVEEYSEISYQNCLRQHGLEK